MLKRIRRKGFTNTHLGCLKAGDLKLNLLYYPDVSEPMREVLNNYKFEDGEFIKVLDRTLSPDYLHVILALDAKGIKGWTGIYKSSHWSEQKTIGVFVAKEFRHLGIGSRLRNEAFKFCITNDFDYCWQDSYSREWFDIIRRN